MGLLVKLSYQYAVLADLNIYKEMGSCSAVGLQTVLCGDMVNSYSNSVVREICCDPLLTLNSTAFMLAVNLIESQ